MREDKTLEIVTRPLEGYGSQKLMRLTLYAGRITLSELTCMEGEEEAKAEKLLQDLASPTPRPFSQLQITLQDALAAIHPLPDWVRGSREYIWTLDALQVAVNAGEMNPKWLYMFAPEFL